MNRYNFPPGNPPGNNQPGDNQSDENKKSDNYSTYFNSNRPINPENITKPKNQFIAIDFTIKNWQQLTELGESKYITKLSKAEKQIKIARAKLLHARGKGFSEENPECQDDIFEIVYNVFPFKKINLEIQHESFTDDGFTRFYFNGVKKDPETGIIISDEIIKFSEEIKKICDGLKIKNKISLSYFNKYNPKLIHGPDNLLTRYVVSIKLGNGEEKEKFWRQLAEFSKDFRDELLNRPKS